MEIENRIPTEERKLNEKIVEEEKQSQLIPAFPSRPQLAKDLNLEFVDLTTNHFEVKI